VTGRPVVTGRAAGLVAGGSLVAATLPGPLPPVLLALVLAAVALDAWTARGVAPVVTRAAPASVVRGLPAPVTLTAPRGIVPRQPAAPGVTVGACRLVTDRPVLGASGVRRGPRRWTCELRADAVGTHLLPAPRGARLGRWGLAGWEGPAGPAAALLVVPDLTGARAVVARSPAVADTASARARLGPVGDGSEFEALRERLPGDALRVVNWKATARFGRLLVNTYRVRQPLRLVVVLDRSPGAEPAGDTAWDLVGGLLLATVGRADRCLLVTVDAGGATATPLRPDAGAVARTLARLVPAGTTPVGAVDWARLPAVLARERAATVVLLTPVRDPAADRELTAAARALARRHRVVVASPLAPGELTADRAAPLGGLVVTARTAAAATAARAQLRSAGAAVVAAPPTALPAALLAAVLRPGP
jgi:uncharacterized protein (DUF58 family)